MSDTIDLERFNSITKYPSIQTYHELGPKGQSTPNVSADFVEPDELIVTEKIDGTNCRIILNCGLEYDGQTGCGSPRWFLGSRNELLTAAGDMVPNPKQGIVDELWMYAEALWTKKRNTQVVVVVYGELYGGRIQKAAIDYTGTRKVGFRVFDVMMLTADDIRHYEKVDPAEFGLGRDAGKTRMHFLSERELLEFCEDYGFDPTPRLNLGFPTNQSPADTVLWLRENVQYTRAALDDEARGRTEGIVVRTPDSQVLRKVRLENYRRL